MPMTSGRSSSLNTTRRLVLDQGSVVQKGTHDELIQQAGIYRDFVSERTESSRWTL